LASNAPFDEINTHVCVKDINPVRSNKKLGVDRSFKL
jgi:hypothetical protein